MKYMLLVYSPEDAWTKEEWTSCTLESLEVCKELQSHGQLLSAAPLHPVAGTACVRVRNGSSLVTTGPFVETTAQLGGYFLIDVPNLDDAIAIATRLPAVKKGTIEIRPVSHLDGIPQVQLDEVHRPGQAVGNPYMLLCYDNDQLWSEQGADALRAAQAEAVGLTQELHSRGMFMSAAPLHSVATATSVRVREGKRMVTDGPFAETREFLGGYYLIRARDLNEAVVAAAKHPGATLGAVEVRRIFELPAQS